MKAMFLCPLEHMGASEILDICDPDALVQVRAKDAHPEIRAYSIGHEGDAQGRMIGAGVKIIHYAGEVIRGLFSRLSIGTDVFHRHANGNSHAGRVAIGTVIGKALQDIGGRLHTVAVVYVDPAWRNVPLDVASIEADVALQEDGQNYEAVDIDRVTGIALSSSAVESPGFDGARLIGSVAFFEPDLTDPANNPLIPDGKPVYGVGDVVDPAQNDLIVTIGGEPDA